MWHQCWLAVFKFTAFYYIGIHALKTVMKKERSVFLNVVQWFCIYNKLAQIGNECLAVSTLKGSTKLSFDCIVQRLQTAQFIWDCAIMMSLFTSFWQTSCKYLYLINHRRNPHWNILKYSEGKKLFLICSDFHKF